MFCAEENVCHQSCTFGIYRKAMYNVKVCWGCSMFVTGATWHGMISHYTDDIIVNCILLILFAKACRPWHLISQETIKFADNKVLFLWYIEDFDRENS